MTAAADRPTSLDRYRRSLDHVAALDADVEREFAERWKGGVDDAGRQLIEASLPFVIRIAREYRRWGVPLEDLVQQGNVGLLKAAHKFDTSKKCRLITYAVYWIRAEIRDYVVRNYRIVRLGTTRTERRAMRSYRRSGVESAEALAQESGMPLVRARKLWPLLSLSDVSLDSQTDDRGPALDRMGFGGESPEDEFSRSHTRSGVRHALAGVLTKLDVRERRIVDARLMSDEPATLESLGQEMGVSKERVRQLEERLCRKLRVELAAFSPAA